MAKSTAKPSGLVARIQRVLGGLGFVLSRRKIAKVADEMAKDLARAPRIAIIGETGVGKSTTLNALFKAGAQIDDIRPCTVETSEYAVVTEMNGSHGPIRVFDMPGLGQDQKADERYLKEYARVLPECDVALWILDGCTRTLAGPQASLRGVVASAMSGLGRLVIGINKIDRMEPGTWTVRTNRPSGKQEQSIAARVDDVKTRLGVPLAVKGSRVIAYSAKQHFHLGELLDALMDACPEDRRWVLQERVDLAHYEDLVDPAILAELRDRKGRNTATPRTRKSRR
jgi:small GTP-binding protein